jgi:hypothetical protein
MTYLHCPRCRFAIYCRAHYLMLRNCPRCLARRATAVPLFSSPLNAMQLRATEQRGATRDGRPGERRERWPIKSTDDRVQSGR